ncbi:MAG: UDP-N-acetylglucosamine 2-epimerase (non-hydrolyzing), partial [Chloroflexi bacterium]|nr:UDP-N-acetylglucosamine 2-epimerase (non-hydrolyzing) [Chloroflexota bacterium]
PETIKMAPVIHELRRRAADSGGPPLAVRVCVTAQHREMLDQVLDIFRIVPDHDLDVMEEGQSPAHVAAAVLARLSPILERERPDWVLVQGDTTTVAAASLAACYAGVKVGHVEAGLRTHDKRRPFPEEINRRVAGVVADRHFAPTQRARANLLREGVPDEQVLVTGNPVIDALHWAVRQPPSPEALALLRRVGCAADSNGLGAASTAREDGCALPRATPAMCASSIRCTPIRTSGSRCTACWPAWRTSCSSRRWTI